MRDARISTLQAMPIFGGIRDDVLQFLLERCASVSVPQGEYFFRENDEADGMFVLESGSVAVLKAWGGEQHLLGHLQQGDCFGEMALMDLFPRSASVLAVAAVHSAEADERQLLRALRAASGAIQLGADEPRPRSQPQASSCRRAPVPAGKERPLSHRRCSPAAALSRWRLLDRPTLSPAPRGVRRSIGRCCRSHVQPQRPAALRPTG